MSTVSQLCVTATETGAVGTWGPYLGAPLPHLNFAEGGQSSTGSVLSWARRRLLSAATAAAVGTNNEDGSATVAFATLDEEAAAVEIGTLPVLPPISTMPRDHFRTKY